MSLTEDHRRILQAFRDIHRDSPDTGPRLLACDVHDSGNGYPLKLVPRVQHRRRASKERAREAV